MHAILWSRFGPTFFGRFLHKEVEKKKLSALIDELVCATLSESLHEARKEKKKAEKEDPPPFPVIPASLEDIEENGREVASCFNFHDHRARCRKGRIGCRQCAATRPQSLSAETTFTQVETFVQKPKSKSTVPEDTERTLYPLYHRETHKYLAAACDSIDEGPKELPEIRSPLPEVDPRVLSLSLKRLLDDDRFVVEYNAILSSLVKCNTAVVMLAAGEDARSSLMYLVK